MVTEEYYELHGGVTWDALEEQQQTSQHNMLSTCSNREPSMLCNCIPHVSSFAWPRPVKHFGLVKSL
jgi:hypothetical protein